MRRTCLAVSTLLLGLAASSPALADGRGVGLGVAAGVAVPNGKPDFNAAFNWGFYVDIPIIYTFHITPSTLVYRLKGTDATGPIDQPATDVSLNFKFMIPLGPIEPFIGVMGGVTSANDVNPHAGVLGGLSISVLPNIDIFAQANYKVIIKNDNNIRDLQIYAGPIFRFL